MTTGGGGGDGNEDSEYAPPLAELADEDRSLEMFEIFELLFEFCFEFELLLFSCCCCFSCFCGRGGFLLLPADPFDCPLSVLVVPFDMEFELEFELELQLFMAALLLSPLLEFSSCCCCCG